LRLIVVGLAVLGLAAALITATPLVSVWANALSEEWDYSGGETMIVLGGGVIEPDYLSYSSYWRSVYASRAWHEGGWTKVVICGGPAARGMKRFLTASGVPEEAIVLDVKSTSTWENAVEAAKLLSGDESDKVLVTSDFHMSRAASVFRKVGLDVRTRPVPDARKRATRWRLRLWAFYDLVLETAKTAVYQWEGKLA
jgi:uncharacterized SAM-binding protein YcdF (DUF218 family)